MNVLWLPLLSMRIDRSWKPFLAYVLSPPVLRKPDETAPTPRGRLVPSLTCDRLLGEASPARTPPGNGSAESSIPRARSASQQARDTVARVSTPVLFVGYAHLGSVQQLGGASRLGNHGSIEQADGLSRSAQPPVDSLLPGRIQFGPGCLPSQAKVKVHVPATGPRAAS